MQNERTKKTKSVRKLLIVGGIILVSVCVFFAIVSQKEFKKLTIADQMLKVEIANTSQKRERGLCCRDSLPSDQGMLFTYSSPGIYKYWMKDTRIALDIFWLNSNKQIVYIAQNVQPDSYPQSFGPDIPAQYVLETNAGFAQRHQIKNRDIVAF